MRSGGLVLLIAVAAVGIPAVLGGAARATGAYPINLLKYPFSLPPLWYPTTNYEPALDNATMTIHHQRHHQSAVNNLNAALNTTEGARLRGRPLGWLLANIGGRGIPTSIRDAIRNNGGSHWNHALFWQLLAPGATSKASAPSADLKRAIDKSFGSFANMSLALQDAGNKRFGSGWAWVGLAIPPPHNLFIISTPNQDNPIMSSNIIGGIKNKMIPILGIDVWEHAYYLRYQNMRSTYLTNIFSNIDWRVVSANYADAYKNLMKTHTRG